MDKWRETCAAFIAATEASKHKRDCIFVALEKRFRERGKEKRDK
jgi:hypothetical protein